MSGPPGPERRFSTGAVVAGAAVGFVATPAIGIGVIALVSALDRLGGAAGSLVGLAGTAALFGPLVAAIVLASGRGDPRRRGFGLGYAIGWAAFLVVGAGLCVALLSSQFSGG